MLYSFYFKYILQMVPIGTAYSLPFLELIPSAVPHAQALLRAVLTLQIDDRTNEPSAALVLKAISCFWRDLQA